MRHFQEARLFLRTASSQQTFQRSVWDGNFPTSAAWTLPACLSLSISVCAFPPTFCASAPSAVSLGLFSCLFHLSVSSLNYPVCLSFSPGPSWSLLPGPLPDAVPKAAHGFPPSPVTCGPGSAREMLSGAWDVAGAGACRASFPSVPRQLSLGHILLFCFPLVVWTSDPGTHRQMPGLELPTPWLSLFGLSVPLV